MRDAGDNGAVRVPSPPANNDSPSRPLPWVLIPSILSDLVRPHDYSHYRRELPRLIQDAAYSLRELAAGRSGSLTGKQRYDILQIANPLLTTAVVVDAHAIFLSASEQYRLLKLRKRRAAEAAEAEGRAIQIAAGMEAWP